MDNAKIKDRYKKKTSPKKRRNGSFLLRMAICDHSSENEEQTKAAALDNDIVYNETIMSHLNNNRAAGFTLIELLVVLSIISLLSSVIIASITSARERARDAQRVSEINSLIRTIDLYFQDQQEVPGMSDTGGTSVSANCSSDLRNDLTSEGYYSVMPTDPAQQSCGTDQDDFFYGWDSTRCEEYYCVSINRLETDWAKEQLSNTYGYPIDAEGKVRDQTCGAQANIDTADFNHCLEDQW